MSLRLLSALVLILAGASPCLAQTAKRYALLIGVTKYDHATMSPLQFPEEDAKALGELLKSGGYEVELLLGSEATQMAIRDRLNRLNKKGNAEGVVLIGLFGHGVEIPVRNAKNETVRDESGQEVTEGCFCPFDTEVRLVRDSSGNSLSSDNGQPLTEPDPASLIKLAELMTSLKVAKAGNRVVFADCCRVIPNLARSTGRSFGASFQAKDLPQNTSVLFGCSPREKALENAVWGHGAFTKCLLEELPKLSAEGEMETGILAARLKKKVPLLVASVNPRDRQTPVPFFTNTVDLQLVFAKGSFEGTIAGDAKELVPGISFRWCRAGTFTMGTPGATDDESPVSVTLTSGYWLGETEVTQGQWSKLTRTAPWSGKKYVKDGPDHAVSYISYNDAVEFCKQLTIQERGAGRLPQDWKYSLPTEAQWEYGCRAGTEMKYSFGESESQLGEYGWFTKNADEDKEQYAHPVGRKKPNAWGLRDMHGNVSEWCSDWYADKLGRGRDPVGATSGSYRVSRGGGWDSDAALCRSACRSYRSPDFQYYYLGFRLAAVPE